MDLIAPNPRAATLAAALLAVGALGVAFLLQYGFGLPPCNLCVQARWPYLAAIVLAAVAVACKRERLLLLPIALAFWGSALVSLRHVGVETGLLELPASCAAATGLEAGSVDELLAAMDAAPPPCDQVEAEFLGLSLAAWNVAFAASVGATLAALWLKARRQAARA